MERRLDSALSEIMPAHSEDLSCRVLAGYNQYRVVRKVWNLCTGNLQTFKYVTGASLETRDNFIFNQELRRLNEEALTLVAKIMDAAKSGVNEAEIEGDLSRLSEILKIIIDQIEDGFPDRDQAKALIVGILRLNLKDTETTAQNANKALEEERDAVKTILMNMGIPNLRI